MCGNVLEWTRNIGIIDRSLDGPNKGIAYPYKQSSERYSADENGEYVRAMRGGSFRSIGRGIRRTFRAIGDGAVSYVGFRVAVVPYL